MKTVQIFTKEPEVVFRLIRRYEMADRWQFTYPPKIDMLLTFGDDAISQELDFWLKSAVACGLVERFEVQ